MSSVLTLPILVDKASGENTFAKSNRKDGSPQGVAKFGLVADVHQDLIHDAPQRMEQFVEAMEEQQADFICQLGDFCIPRTRNKDFLARWNAFSGPKHHVIGNHDTDGGFTTQQTVEFYGMPARTYSFDCQGVHFVSVDTNDPGDDNPKLKKYVNRKQLEWIRDDLKRSKYPTIFFSHRTFDNPNDLQNITEVREVLEQHNEKSKDTKVLACFAGHLHRDYVREINGIQYVEINSASFFWLGMDLAHKSYSGEIHKAYPALKGTVPYKDPLWAYVTVDLNQGVINIKGKKTEWVGPTPWELGASEQRCDLKKVVPWITSNKINLTSLAKK